MNQAAITIPGSASAILAIAVLLLPFLPAHAACYQGKGSKPDTSYIVYIPEKLNLRTRHPWVMAFSPNGNGMEAINSMQQGADENGWIIVASNNSRNGVPFDVIEPSVLDTIYSATRTLAVDPHRMYAGGFSGGSMVAHWLTAKHPELVRGVVINCGMMEHTFQQTLGYPSGKDAVFMTNPEDFRYNEIRTDFQYLKRHACNASWMEFPGGHDWAPPAYYATAFKWLNQQAKLHPRVQAIGTTKASESSLGTLQSKLAEASKAPNPDQKKIAVLQEKIGDSFTKSRSFAEAESSYKRAVDIQSKEAPYSPATAILMQKLGETFAAEGKSAEAAEQLQQAVIILEKGSDTTALKQALESQAKVLYKTGRTDEANAIYARLKTLVNK